VFKTFNTITTLAIVAFFLVGVIDATEMADSEIPIYEVAIDKIEQGDTGYILQVVRMGLGWAQITPSFHVDDLANALPIIGHVYAFYSKLILPSGYLAYPGAETFLFLGGILLLLFPFAIFLKNKRKRAGFDGLPIKFFICLPLLLILIYPLWVWVNLHFFFAPGASAVFGISTEEAIQIWINFGVNSETFSFFFALMALLGIYKGGVWGWKFKTW